jgi:hypothetical protein
MLNSGYSLSPKPDDGQPENDEATENARLARMYSLSQDHTRDQIMQKLMDAGIDFSPSERKADLVAKLHDIHFPEGGAGAEAKPVGGVSVTKVTAVPANGNGARAAMSKLPNIAAAFGLPMGGAQPSDASGQPAAKPMPSAARFGALAQALGLR